MLITKSEFDNWYGNTQLDEEIINLTISAAQEVIEDYIGYAIEAADYSETLFSAYGLNQLNLNIKPINSVSTIKINSADLDLESYTIILKDQFIIIPNYFFNDLEYQIEVDFNAGYEIADIPNLIKITLYEIAGIMINNSRGQIGKKSRTAIDGGSTEYIEITYDKYLKKLNKYKVI
jgi:hypothetical protein